MNDHLVLREAAYEYVGMHKYQGVIFSKAKTRKICNHNCFLYTIVSFVLPRCHMAAVENASIPQCFIQKASSVSYEVLQVQKRITENLTSWRCECRLSGGKVVPTHHVPILQVPPRKNLWLLWLERLYIFPWLCWKTFHSLLILVCLCFSHHVSLPLCSRFPIRCVFSPINSLTSCS